MMSVVLLFNSISFICSPFTDDKKFSLLIRKEAPYESENALRAILGDVLLTQSQSIHVSSIRCHCRQARGIYSCAIFMNYVNGSKNDRF